MGGEAAGPGLVSLLREALEAKDQAQARLQEAEVRWASRLALVQGELQAHQRALEANVGDLAAREARALQAEAQAQALRDQLAAQETRWAKVPGWVRWLLGL